MKKRQVEDSQCVCRLKGQILKPLLSDCIFKTLFKAKLSNLNLGDNFPDANGTEPNLIFGIDNQLEHVILNPLRFKNAPHENMSVNE